MRIFFNNSSKDRVIFTLQSEDNFERLDMERIPDGTLFRVNRTLVGSRMEFVQAILPDPEKIIKDLDAVRRK